MKGHGEVNTWSEVIAAKLESLCPMHSDAKKDQLVLWVSGLVPRFAAKVVRQIFQVYQSIMTRAAHFHTLKSELASTGSLRDETAGVKILSETAEVKRLCVELAKKLAQAKELVRITYDRSDPLEWSLICSSAHNIGPTKEEKLESLCGTVIRETSPEILDRRADLLRRQNAVALRLRLWLDINQWLQWHPSGLQVGGGLRFDYWDKLPWQRALKTRIYGKEKRKKIDELFQSHLKWLIDLGNYVTRCQALCNNPNKPMSERVISSEVKAALDYLFEVRRSTYRGRRA